jgi:hypothetical protein
MNLENNGERMDINYYNMDFNSVNKNDIINNTGKDSFSIMHKSKNVPFFGFGSKIKLSNHFSINAEYLIYNNFYHAF